MAETSTEVIASPRQAALMTLAQANEGVLSPTAVVEAARSEESPLHDWFEWDDGVAAEKFRLAQARYLIQTMKVTIYRPDPETREVTAIVVREYQSRPSQRSPQGGYEPVTLILSDEAKKAELLASVTGELRSVRRRYQNLQELSDVWQAIDSLQIEPGVAGE